MSDPGEYQAKATRDLSPSDREVLLGIGWEDTAAPLGSVFHAESIVAGLLDRQGRLVAATPILARAGPAVTFDLQVVARVAQTGETRSVVTENAVAGDPGLSIFAYGLASHCGHWALPPDILAAAVRHPDHVVVISCHAAANRALLAQACLAYGFTDLQSRVAVEAARTGSIRLAAKALGIAYDTAREALAGALKRARVTRLPALVSKLSATALGVTPDQDHESVVGDLWGLSKRQAAVALMVAQGAVHDQCARALSLSPAVVKKELGEVYGLLQVSSATTLARRLQETVALAQMTAMTGGDVSITAVGAEPLKFIHRPDGSRISISDYGPASGRPVLVAHSSMTSRIVARPLREALQSAGFRPISIDRPGYGLTDEIAGLEAGDHDPFSSAAEDAVRVLDHLKLDRVAVVARGAAQFVVALHHAAHGRCGAVVLVNPDPPTRISGGKPGPFAIVKRLYLENPTLIRTRAALIAGQISHERVGRLLREWSRGSAPDLAAAADPQIVLDYFRAVRTFATGRYAGYVNEQTAFAQGRALRPVSGAQSWRVLVGAHDTMHDPAMVIAYWRTIVPEAGFELSPAAGRFLALSHPHLVVGALVAATGSRAA